MLQEKGSATRRYDNDTNIHFTREFNAQVWIKSCLEREKIITEFRTEINGKAVVFDAVFIENINKRNTTLTVLELKKDVVDLQMIYTKIFRMYPEAIAKTFGLPKSYELTFVGSSIEAQAEYFLDDLLLENNLYPTKSGVLKKVVINFKTYEEILQEYFKRHNITDRQAKMVRNSYGLLSGHGDRMPWID